MMNYVEHESVSRYRNPRLLLVVIWLALATGTTAWAGVHDLSDYLHLNEIMSSNSGTKADADGDYEDWIEIFYSGSEPVNLHGFGLSDDYDSPYKWVFPEVEISPGEFLLIWASGKDRRDPSEELHTGFRISSAGEEVILTSPHGKRLDELSPVRIPTDVSIGRYPDGTGEWYYFRNPTPGQPNTSDGYRELLAPVVFSHPSGFYTEAFDLKLEHPDPDVRIIFTLDGSEPALDNIGGSTYQHMDRYRPPGNLTEKTYRSHEYNPKTSFRISNRTLEQNYLSRMQSAFEDNTNPYYFPDGPVFKSTVVRAKAVKEGAMSDRVQTRSYFVTPSGRNRYSLPVISFAIQEDHLFDYEHGIYVPGKIYNETNPWTADGSAIGNYSQRGIDWERPGSMELFEPESARSAFQQDMGVRIHGGWSRARPMKSLRLYARNMYGDSRFNHQIFPDQPYTEYNRLMLRNSGNDWPLSMMRDALMQAVVAHMKFDTQAYRPFIVFINGEYWGIHNMRERYDRHYLARVHGIDPDNIDLLEGNARVKEGDNTHYLETMSYIRQHNLEDDEHLHYIGTRIDLENYIDYQVAQIYTGNTDWPGNNIDFWRLRTEQYEPDAPQQHDGRWRWLAYDLDFGFWLYNRGPDYNTLRHALGEKHHNHGNPAWSTELFRNLIKNESFRNDFITRYLDQLNTAFRADHVVEQINAMAGYIEPEMRDHIARWSRPRSLQNWQNEIEQLREFAKRRPAHARGHLRNRFDISRQFLLTVDVSDGSMGSVKVNTINLTPGTVGVDEDPWPWKGFYFRGIPVTLEARPHHGYEFFHWEGLDTLFTDPEITLNLERNASVRAVFRRSEDTAGVPDQDETELPRTFALEQNYPNPFNPETVIGFQLPLETHVTLKVYDLLGRKVAVLASENMPAGRHEVAFDASMLTSGLYLYRLEAGDKVLHRVMTLLK